MNLKKLTILFCLITVIDTAVNSLYSQALQTKPSRQSSLEAFSQGNYEKAYNGFRELLLTYPKDPLYKYYSGVCLVKLNRNPREATVLLQEAIQGAGTVKILPPDGLFFLARAQQMSGKFPEASASYNLYSDQAGKKAAKEMGVAEYIQQCDQKKGQISDSELKQTGIVNINKSDTGKIRTMPATEQTIQKTSQKITAPDKNLPLNYENALNEAIEFQTKADSLLELAGEQRKELEKLPTTEKSALKARISDNEKLAASFQKSADQKYSEAQAAMNPSPDTANLQVVVPEKPTKKYYKDTAVIAENETDILSVKKSDTTKAVISPVRSLVEIFSFFEASEKPSTDLKAKIVIDPAVPEGLIYRIQIAVFRNPVLPGYFKGLSPVYGFKVEGTDKIAYYAGMFRKSSDAGKALASVKRKGFKDAFVVALSGNKRISPDRSALMEKEWGGKPFYTIEKLIPETHTDTITPTLTFRVEVVRSIKPLTEDVVDGIRKMAGNRGLDILLLEDSKIAYLIGKFITFETAAEYADLLNRNGYNEAKVVAWLGKKEITVETARKLFDNLK